MAPADILGPACPTDPGVENKLGRSDLHPCDDLVGHVGPRAVRDEAVVVHCEGCAVVVEEFQVSSDTMFFCLVRETSNTGFPSYNTREN